MPPVELPLGRKLPLLISGLIVLVLVASSTAAYIEVERAATTSADERVTGLAKQLADMVHTSIVSRGQLMRKVASDTAVLRLLRSPGTGALDRSPGVSRALERLVVPTDSAGFIEVWDQYGHPRARYDGAMSTLEEITETEQRQMLVARETPPGALDSIHTGPFYARG
ncbi:MAG TPA: hypothetical protein VKP02_14670, partial [Gemmatimonadaceae bacterium]|nr:hypothetical protein [Gemmatimonadaceae bacterium]